jgi:hypothetical protein
MPTMNKIVPLLASTALLFLSYAAAVAAESPDAQRRLTPAPTAAQQGLLPPLDIFIEWREV